MSELSTVAKEIERKYLLSGLPFFKVDGVIKAKFRTMHGWIPGEVIQERITFSGKSGKFFRVIKTGKGLERIEAQEEISVDLFTQLWPITEKRISKTRYLAIDIDPIKGTETDLIWEVDDFDGRNLQLAEIEIPSPDYKVTFPFWLKDYVVKEVTEDPDYLNINLAVNSIGSFKGTIGA